MEDGSRVLPDWHREFAFLDERTWIQKALGTRPSTVRIVQPVIEEHAMPAQAFRQCQSILRFADRHGADVLEECRAQEAQTRASASPTPGASSLLDMLVLGTAALMGRRDDWQRGRPMNREEKNVITSIARSIALPGHPRVEERLGAMSRETGFSQKNALSVLNAIYAEEDDLSVPAPFRTDSKRRASHAVPQPRKLHGQHSARLPSSVTTVLADMSFVEQGRNVAIFGPASSGKTCLAKALGVQACLGTRCEYRRCSELLEELVILKSDSPPEFARRRGGLVRLPP